MSPGRCQEPAPRVGCQRLAAWSVAHGTMGCQCQALMQLAGLQPDYAVVSWAWRATPAVQHAPQRSAISSEMCTSCTTYARHTCHMLQISQEDSSSITNYAITAVNKTYTPA